MTLGLLLRAQAHHPGVTCGCQCSAASRHGGGNLGKFHGGKTSTASKELRKFGLFASSQTIFLCFPPEYNIQIALARHAARVEIVWRRYSTSICNSLWHHAEPNGAQSRPKASHREHAICMWEFVSSGCACALHCCTLARAQIAQATLKAHSQRERSQNKVPKRTHCMHEHGTMRRQYWPQKCTAARAHPCSSK